jgi:hypothetical protein
MHPRLSSVRAEHKHTASARVEGLTDEELLAIIAGADPSEEPPWLATPLVSDE